ncbi:MAG: RluA family pseudouridine synthase [Sedimentisphaerales bacterium]|nr:RluA family pseudouridine synthase [Sedimentisphaerales bacterium]
MPKQDKHLATSLPALEHSYRGSNPLVLRVGSSIQERRLDKYLHGRFSNFSRAMLQEVIKAGGVRVNNQPAKPSLKISPHDLIEITLPELPSREISPENIPLNILYEDDDFLIINKPADMIVHPARGNTHGTIANALAFHLASQSDEDEEDKTVELPEALGEFRPGIVHRLDRNTTGVMILAKNTIAQWKIARQFHDRKVEKSYLAIVHGIPDLTRDRVNAPLGMHPKLRYKYAIRPETGKDAVTFYEVLERFRGFSLLKLTPKTGRTHQIRVHLAHIKHPVVADNMYGGKPVYPWQLKNTEPVAEDPIIGRCALHASTIAFTHPTTKQIVRFEVPLPPDMQNLLDLLRKFRKI